MEEKKWKARAEKQAQNKIEYAKQDAELKAARRATTRKQRKIEKDDKDGVKRKPNDEIVVVAVGMLKKRKLNSAANAT